MSGSFFGSLVSTIEPGLAGVRLPRFEPRLEGAQTGHALTHTATHTDVEATVALAAVLDLTMAAAQLLLSREEV